MRTHRTTGHWEPPLESPQPQPGGPTEIPGGTPPEQTPPEPTPIPEPGPAPERPAEEPEELPSERDGLLVSALNP